MAPPQWVNKFWGARVCQQCKTVYRFSSAVAIQRDRIVWPCKVCGQVTTHHVAGTLPPNTRNRSQGPWQPPHRTNQRSLRKQRGATGSISSQRA